MTLEAFYFAAQIIAAAAIVASLVFVGLQVRAQTKEQAIHRVQARATLAANVYTWAIESREFRDTLAKATGGLEAMSDDEFSLYAIAMRHVLLVHQMTYAGNASGGGAPPAKSAVSIATRFLLTPAFDEWWAHFRNDYSEDFVSYIDGLIKWAAEEELRPFPGRESGWTSWGISDDT